MGSYKKVSYSEDDVKCPFYLSDDRKSCSIRCEGYCDKSSVITRFRSLADRDGHMGIFCVSRYTTCPLYRCTYANKYALDEC